MFIDADDPAERLVFSDWSPKTFEGVPFVLVDPQGDRVPNAILLHGPKGTIPPKMPRSVELRCKTPAQGDPPPGRRQRLGVPAGREGVGLDDRPAALRRRDDRGPPAAERVELADYIRRVDVPGSKLAFQLGGQQLRYLAVHPKRTEPIERIELVKGPDGTAPVVMAVTVEVGE